MLHLKLAVRVFLLLIALAHTSGISAQDVTCPAGTYAEGKSCFLYSDLVLTQPMELESFTTLNCRGHRLLALSGGSGTTPGTYLPSVPALAIAITGDRGVDVRNCVIGEETVRFDFGIIAINSKNARPFGHRIHDNRIYARDAAVTLLRVDDAKVNNNVISWSNGTGIFLLRDSDRNRVDDNIMASNGSPPATIRFVPDGPFREPGDDGIILGPFLLQPVLNLIVNGRLYQFPNSEDGQYAGHEDNVVEGNHISLPGSSMGKSHVGIGVFQNSARSRLVDNTITGAGTGVRLAGLMRMQAVPRAGRCVTPGGDEVPRFCATDADCFLPAVDVAPLGTCPPLVADVRDLRARDTLVEDNAFVGPFNSSVTAMRAAIVGGNGTIGGVIRGNTILGTGTEAGITIFGETLQTGELTRNIVHGAQFGLLLQQGAATSFGARVFLNDFTGSAVSAIGVLGAYPLPSEVSWQGVGNYWGHATPPCFRPTDTPIPALIRDSYPFCTPVAAP